jgi:ABC-2 type transport system ATP-binding protein
MSLTGLTIASYGAEHLGPKDVIPRADFDGPSSTSGPMSSGPSGGRLIAVNGVVVRANEVRKRYSRWGEWVLDGVSLAAAPGSLTVLVGDNGSGKSTLLRILTGAAMATRGEVERPEGSIGYVPERLPVQLRLTARQYLDHMARLRGLDRSCSEARAAEVLRRLVLRPGADVPIGELSKGNNQKVALAQAFLTPVQLLALDEPDSGLDMAAAQELAELINEARLAGTAVFISTHDPAWFATADTGYQLAAGRVVPVARGAVADRSGPTEPAARRPLTRLVLVAIGREPAELGMAPGVKVIGHDYTMRLVELVTPDPDGLLRWALRQGWSFVRGGPATSSSERRDERR